MGQLMDRFVQMFHI